MGDGKVSGRGEKIYRIQNDRVCGRHIVASRKILAGELVINEPALLTGPGFSGGSCKFDATTSTNINVNRNEKCFPKSNLGELSVENSFVCLVCCKNLNPCECFNCPRCNLRLCSESCCNNDQHSKNECVVFPKIRHVWNDSRTCSKKSFYNLILVIRALFYKLRDPKKWDQILRLESKSEALGKVGAFSELEPLFNCLSWDLFSSSSLSESPPPEKNNGNEEINENIVEAAKHCLGVMRINAFSIFSETYSREGLFFLSSFMSHSCLVNTDRQMEVSSIRINGCSAAATQDHFLSGSRMVVRASVDIQKDEPITTTYLSLLYNTEERNRIMISNWLFTCHCKRCLDPTELQTFSAGIYCQCSLRDGDNLITNCKCKTSPLTKQSIQQITHSRPKDLRNIKALEDWLDHWDTGTFLHPYHSTFSHVKLYLCQYYGRQNGGLDALSTSQLKRKVLYCHQIISIYDRIMPGIQMCRGVLLFEMWCALERLSLLKMLPLQINSVPATLITETDVENVKTQALLILSYALPNSSEEAMANILRHE